VNFVTHAVYVQIFAMSQNTTFKHKDEL